jgi:hypothetical protein
MGKAERNRRNRRQRPGPAERLKRDGSTGPFRGGTAEARELFEQVAAETEMPCRATFMDDPLFGGRVARVTGMTPEGGLITGRGPDADRVPVLLFEPVHIIAMKDPVTGLCHEPRIDALVGTGWQRVPPRFVRPGDETGGFIAGYRNPSGPGDERFAAWRAAAARYGHILVITGSRDLLPAEGTDFAHIADVVRASRGALVPLTGDSARQAAAHQQQTAGAGDDDDDDQSEYSELLTSKLRSQESFEVFIAHAVADLIDRDSLARWLTNLWPVACQTCGEPLGSKADISADGPLADSRVLISMHHSACRPSGITPPDGRVQMNRPTASFVAGYLAKAGKPGARDFPVMVVNPSCEQLLLERDGAGGWRNATLDEFAALGLSPATGNFPPPTRRIRADLRDDRLTVTIGADSPGEHTWAISPPPHVREQLRRYHGFAISLTTKTLPTLLIPEDLPGAFNDPEAIVGWVDLTRAPRPRRPAIRLPWPRTPHSAETPGLEVDQAT